MPIPRDGVLPAWATVLRSLTRIHSEIAPRMIIAMCRTRWSTTLPSGPPMTIMPMNGATIVSHSPARYFPMILPLLELPAAVRGSRDGPCEKQCEKQRRVQ
ncbi:hypothetical protein DUY81_01845 [Acidipropionibacterium acidipropionici]|uniref:Uncharacterized protein n=1 Tax=Acidipropionibacterium acidipropionici TaxID=1748 RepID=A0AAC9ANI2_9ACTN|nr:hypothetical protein AXH35_09895 [Acidipropionibacterium acidipropionici]AOZ47179.1 hypothetical protein A8L58_11335 [Acidipropionibacterium acidipropionici]AZP36716.1 hypothetical protein DUY81_01845 [Acidipropionibacterium acidipropionici]